MIISQQQMAVLSQSCLRKFEDCVAGHLERCFPSECRAMGERRLQDVIRYGIKRAATYGISLERDVCKFIDLMFALGRDFDINPDLPWVSGILGDETFSNSTARMERLFAEAKAHMGGTIQ